MQSIHNNGVPEDRCLLTNIGYVAQKRKQRNKNHRQHANDVTDVDICSTQHDGRKTRHSNRDACTMSSSERQQPPVETSRHEQDDKNRSNEKEKKKKLQQALANAFHPSIIH